MKIFILGGDGFCGWPTALHLSNLGHDVIIVDNMSRRSIDIELEVNSLTPIATMGARLAAWKEVSGKQIRFERIDVATGRTVAGGSTDEGDRACRGSAGGGLFAGGQRRAGEARAADCRGGSGRHGAGGV